MKYLTIIFALALSACASPDYLQYAKSTEAASIARSQALSEIAKAGDTAAVAATMALALGAGQSQLQAPQPNQVLQWASVLVPALTQAYAIGKNAEVSIAASNNAAQTSVATTAGFVGIAAKIQAPVVAAPLAPQANITTTLSGSGVLGSGSYSTDQHNVSGSYNPATTTTYPTTTVGP